MRYSAKLWLRLDAEQLEMVERFRASSGRKTTTVAIRHLIQQGLDMEAARIAREKLAGALCVLYDCDTAGLAQKLAELQLKADDMVLSKARVRLDASLCLKVFAIRGSRGRVRGLLERFQTLDGVAQAWFSECRGDPINAQGIRKALAGALVDSGWARAGRDLVMAMPLVLTCGAERLWTQLLAIRPDGHDIAVSFSVHLRRDAFLHVAVLKKPAEVEAALFPLSAAKTQGLSTGQPAVPSAAGDTPHARIGNAS
jgi:metal-responsive CopG/Arc/MetJ family transcriptional regulator